ncbi:MAG: insulinase family protein [Clostridia bacterium]|jgi:Zn-dependent M16 (insulinase) family peptidase|nr:insulinase family protein [Clostridia bacterium]
MLEIGKEYSGFKLKERNYYKYAKGYVNEFEHILSGARLMYIENDEINRCYMIGVPTPVENDKGIPHIIEHSTFLGSNKYDIKDIIFKLSRKLNATYLNAFTAQDHTVYPVASSDKDDFKKLFEVYTDIVLANNITIDENIFRQEGIRTELKDGKMVKSGVVYNEMKGYYGDPMEHIESDIDRNLYDNTYACVSGGEPNAIETLTYEEMTAFYKKHYHPSNLIFGFFGDVDIEEKLKYLNDEYLSKYKRLEEKIKVKKNTVFKDVKKVEGFYPTNESLDKEGETIFTISQIFKGLEYNYVDFFAMKVINNALFISNASKLRDELLDSGYVRSIEAAMFGVEEAGHSLTLHGVKHSKIEEIKSIIEKNINAILENGFDKDEIRGTLNLYKIHEFDESATYPYGMKVFSSIVRPYIYDSNYKEKLDLEKLFEKLYERVNTDYYKNLLEKYFASENKNKVEHAALPKEGMFKELEDEVAIRWEKEYESLSNEDKEKMLLVQEEFKDWQERERKGSIKGKDISELNCDLPLGYENYEVVKNYNYEIAYRKEKDTNLKRLVFVFDISHIASEDYDKLAILKRLMGFIGTKNYTYQEINKKIKNCVGGYNVYIRGDKRRDDKSSIYTLNIEVKYDESFESEVFNMLEEIILNQNFKDIDKTKQILENTLKDMESHLRKASIVEIVGEIKIEAIKESNKIKGLAPRIVYKTIKESLENDLEGVMENIKELYERVIASNKLLVAYSGSEKGKTQKYIEELTSKFSNEEYKEGEYNYKPELKNKAYITEDKVCYNGIILRPKKAHSHKFQVFNNIVNSDYIMKEVRIKNGAYGAELRMDQDSNFICMYSWDDPCLKETIEAYKNIVEGVKALKITQKDVEESIVGIMQNEDAYKTPTLEFEIMVNRISHNITEDIERKMRKEILATKIKDLNEYIEYLESGLENAQIISIGNEKMINENKEMFDVVERYKND